MHLSHQATNRMDEKAAIFVRVDIRTKGKEGGGEGKKHCIYHKFRP